jgi:ribose transport system permease protein
MNTSAESAPRRGFSLRLPGMERASVVYLFGFIIILFSIWTPGTFLTRATFKLVLADQVIVGILALAVIIPLSAGAFDLSCGANLAFALVIISWLQKNTGLNGFVSCGIGVLAATGVGFVNGLISVYFRVNSFIATLGTSQVLAAAALYISGNKQIVGVFSKRFLSFGRGQVLGIPVPVFYLLALALVVWYVLEWTPIGRRLRATGANVEASRLAGVRTDRIIWGSLAMSGLVSGLAGAVFAAKVGTFSNGFGTPLLFPAFAAVFFGATQFQRRANAWGTIIAVYALAFGEKGLQLTFQSGVTWIEPLFNGMALLIAVVLASRQGGLKLRRRPDDAAEAPRLTATSTEPFGGTTP